MFPRALAPPVARVARQEKQTAVDNLACVLVAVHN